MYNSENNNNNKKKKDRIEPNRLETKKKSGLDSDFHER